MRQSGILAATGLYALSHHVDRLADDHRRAQLLAEGLLELPQLVVERVSSRAHVSNRQHLSDLSSRDLTQQAEQILQRCLATGQLLPACRIDSW